MNLLKKGMFFLLGVGLTVACSSNDDAPAASITGVDFTISVENDNGNQIGVTPTSVGGTTYTIDFGDSEAVNDADIIVSSGPKVKYSYPEKTGTYTITVTASSSKSSDVVATKTHTITFAAPTSLADFENAADLNLRDDASGNALITVESKTGKNGQTSKVGVAVFNGGANWDAFSINPKNYINVKNKGIITVDYYQSVGVAREILLKLEGTKTVKDGVFAIEVLTTSTAATGWQTLTFDFHSNKALGSYPNGALPVVLDEYQTMSVFVDFGTAVAGTYWFDNFAGAEWGTAVPDSDSDGVIDSVDKCKDVAANTADGCPASSLPTTAAPTPTAAAGSVISIYSDAYTNVAGTNFYPGWGQATIAKEITIAGNKTLEYKNLNYQGIVLAGNNDVSGKTKLHIDYYTTNSTALNAFLISPGPKEVGYAFAIQTGKWVSVDIPLSTFSGTVNLSEVFQMKFDGNGTVYIDNIYFY